MIILPRTYATVPYNVNGIRINAPQKGVNIFRKGSEIRKVVVK